MPSLPVKTASHVVHSGSRSRQEAIITEVTTQVKTAAVYHSGYGYTARMASAVAEGADAALVVIGAEGNIVEGAWAMLARASAILLGPPTYMGGPSWQSKKFVDVSPKPWFEGAQQNKVFGGFTDSASANGNKLNTLEYFVLFTGQHGGIRASMDIKLVNVRASKRDDPNRMGSYTASMVQTSADVSPEEMSASDSETIRRYGARVAMVVTQLCAGRTGALK